MSSYIFFLFSSKIAFLILPITGLGLKKYMTFSTSSDDIF